jgi:hypothetical protein
MIFLVATVAFIPFVIHMMGIHCDSEKQVMKTSIFSFGDNYEVSTLTDADLYNTSNFKPVVSVDSFLGSLNTESCSKLVKFDHDSIFGSWYDYCGKNDTSINNSECHYALRISHFAGFFSSKPACVQCADIRDVTFIDTTTFNNGKYCFSDAISNNNSNCPKLDLCDIPYGYKFSNTTGNFVCVDNEICGGGSSTLIYDVDIKLKSMGATRYYATVESDSSYKSAMKFKCDGNLNPQPTLFQIPFLDYKLWVLLMVIGAMFFFYVKYLRQ